MRRMNSRQAKRFMDQLGMKVEEIGDVKQVIIRTSRKEIVIDNPGVSITRMQGQDIYQIMGGKATERESTEAGEEKGPAILEEDVRLVAQ